MLCGVITEMTDHHLSSTFMKARKLYVIYDLYLKEFFSSYGTAVYLSQAM
jgi:hypothetical protein